MYLCDLRPHQLYHTVEAAWPLMVPAGCVEYHGPHLPLGVDTTIAEELCRRLARRIPLVIAPTLAYGATGYAVSGPESGTMDVDNVAFEAHAKAVLRALAALGFARVFVVVHHQGAEGPLSLALRKAAAELTFELGLERHGLGWWGRQRQEPETQVFGRLCVLPTVLPAARDVARGDHAGLYETSYMLAARPDLVDMGTLDEGPLPWFCTCPENPSREATATLGDRMFGAMVDAWVHEVSPRG